MEDYDITSKSTADLQNKTGEQLSVICASDSKPGPAIFRLPVEVFNAIGDRLSLNELAAFTLTCGEVLRIYGSKTWDQIRHSPHSRMRLLDVLEREPG